MPFKRRCMTCGSKQWHKEPSSGLIACSEGHVLQLLERVKGGRWCGTTHDAEEVFEEYQAEEGSKEQSEPPAISRRQGTLSVLSMLTDSTTTPSFDPHQILEFAHPVRGSGFSPFWSVFTNPRRTQVVCRDVWALNLCLFPNPIHCDTDETLFTGEDKESDNDIRDTNDQEGDKSDSLDQDEEMDQLLRENSESSSDSDDEENPKPQVNFKTERKTKGTRPEEGPASTIAVLVVTCWLLRIPVMYQDFARIIEAYELPYLDSVRLLPTDMTLHLTKHAIQSLSPHHAPKTLTLHAITSRLAKKFYSKYGIMTPEINAAPLLWRAVRWYKGTPTLYAMTKRLLQVLPISLVLHPSVLPNTPDTNYEKHSREIVPIEIIFIAAITIVLKMAYGLDGTARVPRDPNDPVCSLPLWEDYMENLRSEEKGDMIKFDSRKALSIGDLDDDGVDEYLQFCTHALLGTEQPPNDELLETWFPLWDEKTHTSDPAARTGRQDLGESSMKATLARFSGEFVSPGMKYAIWNGRDVCGELPGDYRDVVQKGAEWVGVDEDYVCVVIEKYEERIRRWWRRESLAT